MRTFVRIGCGAALSALAPAMAAAQQAAPIGPASELGDIVVTARKTSENLQRAPVSVTAILPAVIQDAGIKDPIDLQSKMPAVEFQTATSIPTVSIRGVGTYNLQAGVDPAVAYSVDGIYLSHPQALAPVLVDIARVEVVRGPQGTLYGRNSNGGAISFVTGKPQLNGVDASAAVTLGNFDMVGTELMLNVPLSDATAVRAAFGSNRRDGYYHNGYNNANDYTGRLRLLLQPAANVELIASIDKSRTKNDGQTEDFCPPRSDYALCAQTPWRPYHGLDGRDPADFVLIDTWSAYLEANLSLDAATITSLTSYRDNDFRTRQTFLQLNTSFGFTQAQRSRLFTQELRAASPAGAKLNWLLGAYYSRETGPGAETFFVGGFPFFASGPALKARSKAVFGQLGYQLAAGFRVTGGLRYTAERKSANGPINAIAVDVRNSESRVTWKGGVEYDVSSRSLLYASASNGFKSGGVNQVPTSPAFVPTYRPERITAYQLGSKNRFLSNRVQLNAEAFYYDYRDFQTLQFTGDPSGAFPGIFIQTVNSQKATFYGGEAELSFVLSPVDRLNLSGTLLHARFDRFMVDGLDLSGNQVQSAPGHTFAADYEHVFELSADAKVRFKVASELVAGHYVDNSNATGSYQPSYTRTDLSLTFEDGSGRWTASAFVRNVENKARLMTYAPPAIAPGDLVQVYPPRVFGGTLRWKL